MTERKEYPICPRCGGRVAGAMMTSHAIMDDGTPFVWPCDKEKIYYHRTGISVYCTNADCNWDHLLSDLTTPIPEGDV